MRKRPALAVLLMLAATDAAAAPGLISSRAIYDISLDHTSGGGVVAAHGRMAIEFRDTCDGWSTAQRLIADMADAQGQTSRTDFAVTAWESKDGRTMRFDVSDRRDGKSEERERGEAVLDGDGRGRVTLFAGRPASFTLPAGTQFPTRQLSDVIAAAMRGRGGFRHLVFQGGNRSDLYFSTAVIGRAVDGRALAADRRADRAGLLKGVPAWTALISFFPPTARVETPDYEVASHLFANGVNGTMSLVYPNYTLRAALVRLEPLKPSC